MFSGAHARLVRSLATINLTLGLGGPASRIIPAQKGLAHVASLASDLDAPGPEESFVKVAVFRVRSVCTQPSKRGEKRRIMACCRVHLVRLSDLMLQKKP